MTDANHKNNKKKSFLSIGVATVVGVFVGAVAVIAGGIALKDKKNQDKVKEVIADVKDQTIGFMGKIKKGVKDTFHHEIKKV